MTDAPKRGRGRPPKEVEKLPSSAEEIRDAIFRAAAKPKGDAGDHARVSLLSSIAYKPHLMVTIDDAIPTAVSEADYNQEANRASGPEFP